MELIFTNAELTTMKKTPRIMIHHSSVAVQMSYSVYFLLKPIMFKKKSISANFIKRTESQTHR